MDNELDIKQKDQKEDDSKLTVSEAIIAIVALVIILALMLGLVHLVIPSPKYINKSSLLSSMSSVIKNGGAIDEVKQIFNSKTLVEEPFFGGGDEFKESHYTEDIALSYVLSDLLVEYYKQKPFKVDSTYISHLENIVNEYNAVHPYDGLEDIQRYYLENIRQKLDSNYTFIQEDIVQLGDELDRKNLLVNKYLAKSETS